MGRRPTHPELLDWLASRFIEDGWSVKKFQRRLIASATWQQRVQPALASEAGEAGTGSQEANVTTDDGAGAGRAGLVDPANDLLWSFPRLRLDAESIRDALLSASGRLVRGSGGPHPFPPMKTWNWTQHSPFTAVYPTRHRSVYVMQQRIRRHPFFAVFDGADTNSSTGARMITTTPLQALFVMNDPFAHEQAEALAQRVAAAFPGNVVARISLAHKLLYGREATAAETSEAVVYLAGFRARLPAEQTPTEREASAWTSYARALMGANEFIFLD
jgi:hypothetical protein